MSYFYFFDVLAEDPTMGLYSEDLIPLVDKFKNVNLFCLNRYYNSGYSDCEGEYNHYHFVFGAKNKKSAMNVLIHHYFSDVFRKIKKFVDGGKKIPLSKYLKENYIFGEKLVNTLMEFYQNKDRDLNPIDLVEDYFAKILYKWDNKEDLWKYIVGQYEFGGDFISAIGKEMGGYEECSPWIDQWVRENPEFFGSSGWNKTNTEFRKKMFTQMVISPSSRMVKEIAKKFPDSPLGKHWDSITINCIKSFLSQIFENWKRKPHLWEAFSLAYDFGDALIEDVEKFWQISRESISFEHIKSYLFEKADELISDKTEWLFKLGRADHSYAEEIDLAKVVTYFKDKYPKEFNEIYPSGRVSTIDVRKYKKLSTFLKKTEISPQDTREKYNEGKNEIDGEISILPMKDLFGFINELTKMLEMVKIVDIEDLAESFEVPVKTVKNIIFTYAADIKRYVNFTVREGKIYKEK